MVSFSNSSAKINSKLKELQSKKDHKKYWNITWRSGNLLSQLISLSYSENILEIGTSNGFSTLWMLKGANQNSNIYTVEVNEKRFEEAKENLSFSSQVTPLNGEVFELIESYPFQQPFDFVFLDAAHKKYKEILEKLEEKNLLSKNSVIVADNIDSHSYMDKFKEFAKERYDCREINIDSGFLVCRKN